MNPNIVAIPMKERHSIAVGIWVKVGARDEEPRLSGVSHFLEHIVFKGTTKRSTHEIKEAVEGIGGSLNAFTGEEVTCFLAKASHRHIEQVFDVLADMVFHATLDAKEIEKERSVILEEVKMTQDQPSQLVDELLSEIIWPAHALGRPIAGTVESVGGLTREDILHYKRKFYVPGLMTVVAAGAIEQKKLEKMTEMFFPAANQSPLDKKMSLFRISEKGERFKFLSKATEQTHLAIGLHSLPKDHPDEYVLDILNVLLGGNMSSRLFNEVREERGLAYDIGSYAKKYHETGAFVVEAGVDHSKVKEAIEVILNELKKAAEKSASDDELKRSKEFYLGQLDLSLENSMNQMLWAGESITSSGKRHSYEEVQTAVEKVGPDDLKRVAKEIFQAKALHLAVVGPTAPSLEKDFSHFLSII